MITEEILKEHLGGIQTKLNFATVLPFVKTAEFDFRKMIGKALFDALPTLPNATSTPENQALEIELNYWATSCMAWKAYDLAVPHLKIRFGDLGMMKSSPANSVAITKWEYVDTRESNLAMYDIACENFFELLETLLPTVWTSSDAYKLRTDLFIQSPQQLQKYVPLVGRNTRFFQQIVPHIREAEELQITDIVTAEIVADLKEKLQNQTPLALKEKQLVELIKKCVAPLAVLDAIPLVQLKVDEEGIRQIRKKDGIREEEVAEKGYRSRLILSLDNTAQLYLTRLRAFMDANASETLFTPYFEANKTQEIDQRWTDFTDKPHVIL